LQQLENFYTSTAAMKDSSYKITIHTDGSCLGNPGPGGWAAVLRTDRHRKEICGGYALTTNNRMEILAVIKALGQLRYPCQVDLYTDSRYVCDSVEKGWIWNWQKKGWIKSNRKPALNADLWQSLIPLLARHKVRFHWLRGHAGHAENERCDELARCQATRPDLPTDNGYVQTEIPRKNPQAPA
jgi:ribonuclease HI